MPRRVDLSAPREPVRGYPPTQTTVFYDDRDHRHRKMFGMGGSGPPRAVWRRHPGVVVVACGLVGSALGWVWALSIRSPGEVAIAWLWLFAIAAATVAGTLGGVFLGLVAMYAARKGLSCPRCGTRTSSGSTRCPACELSLIARRDAEQKARPIRTVG